MGTGVASRSSVTSLTTARSSSRAMRPSMLPSAGSRKKLRPGARLRRQRSRQIQLVALVVDSNDPVNVFHRIDPMAELLRPDAPGLEPFSLLGTQLVQAKPQRGDVAPRVGR